jgi:hypothetical protein
MLFFHVLQVLGDNTDQLVELLINFFRSGIDDATAGLSESATQKIMEQVSGEGCALKRQMALSRVMHAVSI